LAAIGRWRRIAFSAPPALVLLAVTCVHPEERLTLVADLEISDVLQEVSPGILVGSSGTGDPRIEGSETLSVREANFEVPVEVSGEFGRRVCDRIRAHLEARHRLVSSGGGWDGERRTIGGILPGYLLGTHCNFRVLSGGRTARVLVHIAIPQGGGWSTMNMATLEY
jgi:hypothetical protein